MEPYGSRAIEMLTGTGRAIWSVSHGQGGGEGRPWMTCEGVGGRQSAEVTICGPGCILLLRCF